jgi:glucose/mannose-6-phosphate isomerase
LATVLDLALMNKVDKQGMYKIYDVWPQIAKNAYGSVHDPIDYKNIDHVVFAGMGGSGAIGDLFSAILSKTDVHVSIVKGYLLPKTVDKNTLVVATSVSGNTVETLSALRSAANTRCKIICFSAGGKMGRFCKKEKIDYRKIPQIHSPRVSFVSYVYSILGTLNSVIPIKKIDIAESLTKLETMNEISSSNLSKTNPALDLAKWISGIPMIYYPHGLQAVAVRFKSTLQENAKSHAMMEDVIEACHNGIVSWEKKSNVQPVMLVGQDDYVKTKQRWAIIREYFEKNSINYREVHSVSGNILSKLVCMIYLLDYTSIYSAILRKVDPSPVRSILFVKNKVSGH